MTKELENNSIKTRALEKNPTIKISGCPCHALHDAAFAKITKFDIEDHCVDLYYWLENSNKSKSALEKYCVFCDTESTDVIPCASTRWLGLERYVKREFQKYVAIE